MGFTPDALIEDRLSGHSKQAGLTKPDSLRIIVLGERPLPLDVGLGQTCDQPQLWTKLPLDGIEGGRRMLQTLRGIPFSLSPLALRRVLCQRARNILGPFQGSHRRVAGRTGATVSAGTITNARGDFTEVKGPDGLVHTRAQARKRFDYTSGASLNAPSGMMAGLAK